jgi:hypothetical protein
VRLPTDVADRRLHALGEGDAGQPSPVGTIRFAAPRVDGVPVPGGWAGWSAPAGSARVASDPTRMELDYRLDTGEVVLTPPMPSRPVPVLTDPATAAVAGSGTVTLLIDGLGFDARPVAVLDGFPTVTGRFAVLDRAVLADLIERTQPGTANPGQVWLRVGPQASAALAAATGRSPLDRVTVTRRTDVQSSLGSDPVADAATALLMAGAGLALAVALAAVVLLVVAERTDDAAVHYAWEADGVPPGTLRASLWWGAVATVLPAAVIGVAAGTALTAAAARLVAVSASGTAPVPPLRAQWWDPAMLAAAAAGTVLVLALAGWVAAASLREAVPVRSPGRVG